MHPLIILLIGLVVVVGMIVVLRLNAFLALISAALLVSLLAPGDLGDKVERVATAFGDSAGKIGIVIALAAIIGKCLMDSGAADRVVRSFLRVLGEKRASVALMGSGFVLSVPVFFDTVFYLLVPLARSLWKQTRKNYILYILSIGLGATITHTLVPPTPGPLLMAANLNIDIGWMILIGALIALPTAVAGLVYAYVMNRLLDRPMRPYAGEPEQEPLEDHQLPGLVVSILPVVLPVILISMNTVATTLADAERAARFRDPSEVRWVELGAVLDVAAVDPSGSPAGRRLLAELPEPISDSLRQAARTETTPSNIDDSLAALNRVLASRDFHAEPEFSTLALPEEGAELLGSDVRKLSLAEVERLNRLILEASLPEIIRPHEWETGKRRVANVTALLGNANLALFLSAAIAMWVLVRNRKLGLPELAKTTETALMSGGVIILITAAGGAFGAMLKAANVGEVIESMAGGGGQTSGLAMLLIAFGVTSVLKIAQGSSTVAMITSSGMLAAMGTSAEQLGFHPVYLAAAIGSGSLVTSWMNDSGFWIFTRMSALTEIEGLKTWSAATAFAGFVGFGFTLLFAWLLPLI